MYSPLVYAAINQDVLQSIPLTVSHVLDIGCGDGALGAALKQRGTSCVEGFTYSEAEARKAQQRLDHVYVGDLNSFDVTKVKSNYDCIICSHVLEHLAEPWKLVSVLESLLAPSGMLIIAIPNLLFFKQRWQLVKGNFRYSHEGGLMDITHLRFFDWQSSETLYQHTTLHLLDKKAYGMFPQPLIRKLAPALCKQFDAIMVKAFPGLFGLQFIIRLRK